MTILKEVEDATVDEDGDEGDTFAISKTIATLWQCHNNAKGNIFLR